MQDINIAGVVAKPNCVTATPRLARPATIDVDIKGLESRGSDPTDTRKFDVFVRKRSANQSAKAAPMKKLKAGVRVTGSSGLAACTHKKKYLC